MHFSTQILTWYNINKRDLPWRTTKDPYFIWLSEIILQQTRVKQGIPYYNTFIENFPSVYELAAADEEKVLKLWQGLGYYSRARNLHATAKNIVENFNGTFPNSHKELLKLKGIGDYTASAIASICFNEQKAVVDGNVYRVLSRYFGVATPINSTAGIAYFKKLANTVMQTKNFRDYNQGIMEFGALQCAPKSPDCTACPLNDSCVALQKDKVKDWPVKIKKAKIKKRYFNYLVLIDPNQNTLMEQRTGKGIWQNLWQFPLFETEKMASKKEVTSNITLVTGVDALKQIHLYNTKSIVHKLSHQHLYTQFWIVPCNTILQEGTPLANIKNYPVPVLIADFIADFKLQSV